MDRKIAKELLHIQGWLERADEITRDGQRALAKTKQPAPTGGRDVLG